MLPFESTEETFLNSGFKHFRVGTCYGLWRATDDAYEILAVKNHQKGNGHFKEAMRWFEQSCRRDHKKLRLREVWNLWLYWQSVRHYGYKRMKGTWFTLEKSFE
jgi:hypothetical protein